MFSHFITYPSRFFAILSMCLLAAFSSTSSAFAHNASQLPFVQIDAMDAQIYPVGYVSAPEHFPLPQDSAPGQFLLHQSIRFDLIPANLPVSPDSISKISFKWDFGDASPQFFGTTTRHSYSKIGSYLVSLQADNPADRSGLQVLDLIYINILPSKDYVLPVSIITVNNQKSLLSNHPLVKANFDQKISLDGSASHGGSSPLKSYLWDGGNEQGGSTAVFSQTYGSGGTVVQPVLRVTDQNGFRVDTPVLLQHDANVKNVDISPTPSSLQPANSDINQNIMRLISLIILIMALAWVSLTVVRKKPQLPKR